MHLGSFSIELLQFWKKDCNCNVWVTRIIMDNSVQMQERKCKQSLFQFQKITIDSRFESGNLEAAEMPAENQFNLWIGSDPNANYKTWFYFSIEGIKIGTTVTFLIMNMNNQIKLYKEGLVPVYRTDNGQDWARVKIPITANGVVKGENGFQITFKHCFMENCKHYFAFTYPWTNWENEAMLMSLMEKASPSVLCKQQKLCDSYQKRPVNLLTITQGIKGKELNFETKQIGNSQILVFPERKGIFISARVHPGETASSHIMNGLIKGLFSSSQLSKCLLQNCVFYIVPIINPDGVAQGNFRTDSQGKNLNRYYTNPNPQTQPEISSIKQLLLSLINQKRIQFCLDLHAHVNKQGAFIYGNSTTNLYSQMRVLLFPKLMSFNSQIFDFDSCNFSQKNMVSKDKGDQLSKEGASRVAIFRDTGLVECWTLECNYNSAKLVQTVLEPVPENKNNNVSHALLCSRVQPEYREEVKILDIPEFEGLGRSILQSIADFYQLKPYSRVFASKLKNFPNLEINLAVSSLRLIPFRFDAECRKLLDSINSSMNVKYCIERLAAMMEAKGFKLQQQPVISSTRAIKEASGTGSNGKRGDSLGERKANSLRKVEKTERKQEKVQGINYLIKAEQKMNKIPQIPLPKPKKQPK